MVVAEIPLWLVHTSGEPGGGGSNSILNPGNAAGAVVPPSNATTTATNVAVSNANESKTAGGSSGGGIAAAPGSDKLDTTAATNSLSLLQNSRKKCAIYSLDINPAGTRIATCGGDGTVRLWNAGALFSKKRGRFEEDGKYESSEASEQEVEEEEEVSDTNAEEGDDYDDDDDDQAAGDDQESSQQQVHDLSNLVRRKKGGEAILPSPVKQQPTDRNKSIISNSINPAAKAVASPSRQSTGDVHHQKRLLCTLSAHTGSSVLAVRFSNNGKYLASSGDDGSVCIYTKDNQPTITGNLTDNFHHVGAAAEHWSRIKLCRGHGLDVVGLAWAPDDSHLVSCSLDSETPIIVWKLTDLTSNQGHVTHSNVLVNPYKVLGKGIHTSTVKGVTFDPAGTYLASSGDDPAICIWRAHDDWGLERRIDAGSGIFRQWKEDNAQSLSSQTLFRRLSWSTDGAFICSTNCVVKNKHVASTIAREGWNVSTGQSTPAGAANLVGHKQPVVVSRHCSYLLAASSKDNKKTGNSSGSNSSSNSGSSSENDEEHEPSYATLLALGDRHGFVTVWSTRKSRPIFKLQCSETRCTVTDLAWAKMGSHSMVLLVSLLDGHCVALRFKVPEEVGPLLPSRDQARLFKFRYGIDLDEAGDFRKRGLFVGDSSTPKFIENALQMSLENRMDEEEGGSNNENGGGNRENGDATMNGGTGPMQMSINSASIRSQQQETQSKGKKRIRPVFMSVDASQGSPKRPAQSTNGGAADNSNKQKNKETDPLKYATDLAEKAAATTDGMVQHKRDTPAAGGGAATEDTAPHVQPPATAQRQIPASSGIVVSAVLPHNTSRIQSVDLPLLTASESDTEKKFVANCTNSFRVPLGSKGASLSCIDIKISEEGTTSWKDQIVGTACSALAASPQLLAVGTADGSVQLYGTSPTLGWSCGIAFRSHPLLVLGHPIVALQIHERKAAEADGSNKFDMLVVTADGTFGVYELIPELRLRYKGSIMPAMVHMSLGTAKIAGSEARLPKLSRIQITETDQLLLLLSLSQTSNRAGTDSPARGVIRSNTGPSAVSAYGSIQAFVYNLKMELWTRISDGRFVLSDFYSTLPSEKLASSRGGTLSKLDDAVRLGALDSSLTPSHRSRAAGRDSAHVIFQSSEDKANYSATRSHCEDRMACALAVGSASEFQHWLTLYVRTLSLGGHADMFRVLVDMLLFGSTNANKNGGTVVGVHCWWLSSSPEVLNLDRKSLVRTVIIPEMSKNRSLQRLTNEISMEINAL